ncbi:MAG: hypothetical protein JW891_02810 [Candidatus Lokiarchaeota archaeon]|nr:hypothetical protein [Candidatus Lokiarchaeota archaeon]
MKEIPSFILATTFHEPEFKLKIAFEKALPDIKRLFPLRIACCTPTTDDKVVSFLKKEGFVVSISPSMSQVETYTLALKLALELVEERFLQKILYIDLDRLVHWINFFPNEIANLIEKTDFDYLHIGRNARAFDTHPSTQKETEIVVNEMASIILGFERIIDVISACFALSPKILEKLIAIKHKTSKGFYCSWPVLCWRLAKNKILIEVEGLEWETPDRFQEEINDLGYVLWMEQFQSAREWKKRVALMRECILEFINIINISDLT